MIDIPGFPFIPPLTLPRVNRGILTVGKVSEKDHRTIVNISPFRHFHLSFNLFLPFIMQLAAFEDRRRAFRAFSPTPHWIFTSIIQIFKPCRWRKKIAWNILSATENSHTASHYHLLPRWQLWWQGLRGEPVIWTERLEGDDTGSSDSIKCCEGADRKKKWNGWWGCVRGGEVVVKERKNIQISKRRGPIFIFTFPFKYTLKNTHC